MISGRYAPKISFGAIAYEHDPLHAVLLLTK
jgi:hypothetical protein